MCVPLTHTPPQVVVQARTFAGQFQEISLSLRPQSEALRGAIPKEARDFANRVLPFIDQLDPTFDEVIASRVLDLIRQNYRMRRGD
jgi:hypothetical protein